MSISPTSLDLEQIGVNDILHALADGAYVTDPERRIVFWNRAAMRITGWRPEQVVGRTCFDNVLVHVDKDGHTLCGKEYCPLHRAIVTGERSHEPLLVFAQHSDGRRVPVEVSVAPIRDRTGTVVGGIEVFRDLADTMEDLRRAKVIQEHALKVTVPPDPRLRVSLRYTPEGLVGGDFFRVETLDSGCRAFMVADVMGHGLAAALYTMQLRVLWDDARGRLARAAELMGEMNRRLAELVALEGSFATAVLALIDASTGDLSVVRAGHPAPWVFRRGGKAESVGEAGPALGLVEAASYREWRGRLGPGDVLLLYTDGAVEIINRDGRELSPAGLAELAEGIMARRGGLNVGELEQALLQYSDRIRLEDDLTLLSVERCGGSDG